MIEEEKFELSKKIYFEILDCVNKNHTECEDENVFSSCVFYSILTFIKNNLQYDLDRTLKGAKGFYEILENCEECNKNIDKGDV